MYKGNVFCVSVGKDDLLSVVVVRQLQLAGRLIKNKKAIRGNKGITVRYDQI